MERRAAFWSAQKAGKVVIFGEKFAKKWGRVTETDTAQFQPTSRLRFMCRATEALPPALQQINRVFASPSV